MNEQEIMAKALEIAVTLTKADNTYLRIGERNEVFISDPLFSTLKAVIRVIKSDTIVHDDQTFKIFRE